MLQSVSTGWGLPVGSNLKLVNFFMQHLGMLHDVVYSFWPVSCNNNVAPDRACALKPRPNGRDMPTQHTAISGKVVLQRGNAYATMPKVIMGNGGFTVAWLKLKVF